MPPWGRPVTGWSPWPSVSPTPALHHCSLRRRHGRAPPPEPLPQPLRITVVAVSFDGRFSHRAVRTTWPMTGAVSHRLSCPKLLPGPVATRQQVGCRDGFEATGACPLEAGVRGGRDAQRAQGAVALRDGVPADHLRPVALVVDALHAGGAMVMPAAPVGSCTAAVSPSRRALMQERPAAAPRGHRPQAQEMAQAVRLRRRSLRRSALQGGWHGVLQSCLPGPCCLCRLPHAVSPCLRTATCVARRTVRGSDSLAVCRRPACGRRDVPAPLRCRNFQGLPRSRRFSPGMPRPEDPDRPSRISPQPMLWGWLPVRAHRRRLLSGLDEAVPDVRDVRLPLWPPWFPGYASYASFGVVPPPPHTHHTGRVGGSTFPGGDFHPTRNAKLRLAH